MKYNTFKYPDFNWIDIENPSKEELLELSKRVPIDMNYLEDAFESGHLPKIEINGDHIFMILRAYGASENQKVIEVVEISNKIAFLIYKNELITLHRTAFPFIQNVPKNLKTLHEVVLFLMRQIFFATLFLMFLLSLGIFFWFKKKKIL
ncbi:MAG: hypothetical protein C4K58_04055 [Flavobacteriaceae bacterium]|nr:MAG: hypothetical protein C4K58_04055 [Flavobacteriaceae bacterium]